MAVDEARRVRGEEDRRAAQFRHVAPAALRRARLDPGGELRIGDQRLVELGLEVARRNRIGIDPVPHPFGRHGAGQIAHRRLAGRVGRDRFACHARHQRGDVDDLAAPARDHPARHRLSDEEHRGDVGRHHPLEHVLGKILERRAVLHAGIVDEDVDLPDFVLGVRDGVLDALLAGDIESHRPRPCAAFGEFGRGLSQRHLVACIEDHFGPRAGQRRRDRQPNAAARSGHQRPAPGERELR